MELTREILEALGAPFPDDEVEFLPRGSSSGKARALAYIDARSVMRRLDAVVGPGNWSFDFDVLHSDGKMVKGKLTVLGVTKCDAGESGDEDEPLKSAVSDALKRCAVHFNIGRYLYYLPAVWVAYDNQRRRFTEQPRLSPASVEHALAICGVGGSEANGRTAARPVAPAARERVIRAPEGTRPPVESSGDRAATSVPPVLEKPAKTGQNRPDAPAEEPRKVAPAAPAAPVDAGTSAAGSTALACSGSECGRPLTKGQHDVSLRAYGRPLCPACQKQHARIGA